MQLAPSLHRIGSDYVNVYFVEDARGITVIDAGVSGQWMDLVAELAAIGRSVDEIRALLLTHGDTDHLGFAERLRRDHGVPVYVHEADAPRARGEEKPHTTWGRVKVAALLGFLWYAGTRGGLRTTYLREVRTLRGGEELDLPGSPRVIPLPGHSPGSVAIHVPVVDALFVGDGLTTRNVLTGVRGPQPAPFTDRPDQALASLAALENLEARWILPGHGPPWNGGAEDAVRRVRAAAAASA